MNSGGISEARDTPKTGLVFHWRVGGVRVGANSLPAARQALLPWLPVLGSPLLSPRRRWAGWEPHRGGSAREAIWACPARVMHRGCFAPSRKAGKGRGCESGAAGREPVQPAPCRAMPCRRLGRVLRPCRVPACSWAVRVLLFIYFSSLLSPFAC